MTLYFNLRTYMRLLVKRHVVTFMISALVTVSSVTYVHGQSIETTRWKASSVENLEQGEELTRASEFVFDSSNSILWKQDNGNKIYSFEIISVAGAWTDLSQDGVTTYTVSRAGLTGTIKFQRSSAQYTLSMNFVRDGKNVMPYIFNVSSVDPL